MFKLTAPVDVTARIGGHVDYFWTVLGVAYTDRADIAERLATCGYDSQQVDEVPAEHVAAVVRLEAWPYPIATNQADGADPDQKYRFTDPDGRVLDVRDLINGALTLRPSTHSGHAPIPMLNGAPVA